MLRSFCGFVAVLTAVASRPGEMWALSAAYRRRLCALTLALVVALWPGGVPAHDPSAWGGLFRTRDDGATWLPVNPGSFVSGALALAVSPADPNHLLLATDSGVSRTRNGGRDWEIEGPGFLIGPAFAAAFDVDGERALVSAASAIFRTDGDRWRPVQTPAGAAPARALVSGSVRGRVYLAGWTGFYRSEDWGQSWFSVSDKLQAEHVSALMVPPGRPDEVYAVAGGRLWASADGARSWQPHDGGLPAGGIEVVGCDLSDTARLWAVAAGQVFRTDDRGQRWRPAGVPLPERPVSARAIAASGNVLLIATDRGLFRSLDAGERWQLSSEGLPAHLEAGLLAGDPLNPGTLYAGFAVTPAEELRQRSTEGGRAFARLDIFSLAGGAAFLALLGLGAGALLRRLARTHYRTQLDRHDSPAIGRTRRSGHVPR